MDKHLKFLNIANEVSNMSNHPHAKLGAVLVEKNKIISSGYNSNTKTHPMQKQFDKLRFSVESTGKLHAETACLASLINNHIDMKHCTLYVSRHLKNGNKAIARPCKACMAIIKSCGIRNICYTTSEGYAIEKLQ